MKAEVMFDLHKNLGMCFLGGGNEEKLGQE